MRNAPSYTAGLLVAKHDHAVRQVVWRQRHGHTVAQDHANSELAHPAAELRAHLGARVGLHLELSAREHVRDRAVELDVIVAGIVFRILELASSTSAASDKDDIQ